MMVWIDASAPAARLKVFGLTVTERHLQALLRLEPKPTKIIIDTGATDPATLKIPASVTSRLPIAWSRSTAPFAVRMGQARAEAGTESLLLLDGIALGDQRLHGQLARSDANLAVFAPDSNEGVAMLFVRAGTELPATDKSADLTALAKSMVSNGAAKQLTQESFDGFIRKLRRSLPFYLFRIGDEAAAAKVQRFLFWSNYKGSTDIFTRYVYPPLVWLLVRPLARARVHPNVVTIISILMTFAAVPLFAAGHFIPGLLLAYGMSVLDSVDGKLARLTFTDSRLGNLLDHGLDIMHPPLWYVAWAWGLAGGDLASPIVLASLWMTGFYVADRLVLAIYRNLFKRGLHTHAPIDAWVRSFISRRNINLPLFTIGVLAGIAVPMFYFIVAWQVVTFGWHAGRTFWILAIEKARPGTAPVRPAGS